MSPELFEPGSHSHFLLVLAMLEGVGLTGYLAVTAGPAFSQLVQTNTTPAEAIQFFVGSPDRIVVAVGIAALAYVMSNTGVWGTAPGDSGM